MRLLPSEQSKRIAEVIAQYNDTGRYVIEEPCDCGDHIRHNNGGNYHEIIILKRDRGQDFIKRETTCELTPTAEWRLCDDLEQVIRDYADWL